MSDKQKRSKSETETIEILRGALARINEHSAQKYDTKSQVLLDFAHMVSNIASDALEQTDIPVDPPRPPQP